MKVIQKILIVAYSPSSTLMEISINNAFKELGYYSEIFPVNKNFVLLNRRLLEKIKSEKIDLLFILESNWIVLPETIVQIKNETNTLVILWETNLHIWKEHQSDCLPLYDAIFCLDSYLMPIWKTANVKRAFYLPVCVDEKLNSVPKVSDTEREFYQCDIGFVGRLREERVKVFESMLDFNFKIFGPQLPSVPISVNLKKKVISDSISIEQKRKFYDVAKINVDIQGNDLHINSPTVRSFEIALCGGFPLTEHRKGLDEMFSIGKELICFYNTEDLINKAKHYLCRPAERQKITARCVNRILKEHTVKIRMEQMISVLLAK